MTQDIVLHAACLGAWLSLAALWRNTITNCHVLALDRPRTPHEIRTAVRYHRLHSPSTGTVFSWRLGLQTVISLFRAGDDVARCRQHQEHWIGYVAVSAVGKLHSRCLQWPSRTQHNSSAGRWVLRLRPGQVRAKQHWVPWPLDETINKLPDDEWVEELHVSSLVHTPQKWACSRLYVAYAGFRIPLLVLQLITFSTSLCKDK